MQQKLSHMIPLLFLFIFFSSLTVGFARDAVAGESPFTPKAYLLRYWTKEIHNNLPKSSFLLSKASPLTAVESAAFAKLAAQNALSTRLPEFCSSAQLLCFPEVGPSLEKHDKDANFVVYQEQNFTNYGTGRVDGVDSFKNYSESDNLPINSFRRYSRGALDHNDNFISYATSGNVVDQSFNTYATTAGFGAGQFKKYAGDVNVPNLRFTSYSDHANGRSHSFSSYTENGNAGQQSFTNYGKHGNEIPNEFNSYGTDSNVIGSDFSNYGEDSNLANDTFTNYGVDQNNPKNNFKNYGEDGNGATESFSNYRLRSNVGDDSFQNYAKSSNGAEVDFTNYGKSFNEGTDKFTGYGKGEDEQQRIGFKGYGVNNTFKEYAKERVTFKSYTNRSSANSASMALSGSLVKKWVQPGKFFRESKLKKGTVMPMPDIKDKMPQRSFLPRSILSKLPFSTSKVSELKQIFKVDDNSTMEKLILDTLKECEGAPSQGETKRCVGSVEDMIDFVTSVLGRNVAVRTTENLNGSNSNVMVGSVKGINGGKVTQSVSCHQSLFPYLLYYCHSVPKVRVYEADILDSNSKAKINHGVAICHLDTSSWSPSHGAFFALGSTPGKIEVCHWIFQNDMTWTIAD
ncbi:polygalacturonase-1 non-catalytic subunit beta-like [Quillaja saponaria]|uniref:Polygalacturonase-1 non-catalytic subunit beta-like n=1 Tax=Quillaja saponaria TaxID=32244 RepID=A0AAD7PFF3_QUISA|nr:polygalacturonase-1 non-catalytic subunit beta-like [Quillaja saponaria]